MPRCFQTTSRFSPLRFPRAGSASCGFTLVELMVALAVFGILTTTAIPSYRSLVLNNCLATTSNSLVTALQLARSEATRRRASVSVGRLDAAAAAGDWAGGWAVWLDADGDGLIDTGETTLRRFQTTCGDTRVLEAGNNARIAYEPTGQLATSATFRVCDLRSDTRGRRISVAPVGRPSTAVLDEGGGACL